MPEGSGVLPRDQDLETSGGFESGMREGANRERAEADPETIARRKEAILAPVGEGLFGVEREGVKISANPAAENLRIATRDRRLRPAFAGRKAFGSLQGEFERVRLLQEAAAGGE